MTTLATPIPAALSTAAAEMVALTNLKPGQRAVIRDTQLETDDRALLRAMGLGLGATIRVFRIGEPCVLAVGGVSERCKCGGMCRVGLARPLAEKIFVEVQG